VALVSIRDKVANVIVISERIVNMPIITTKT